MSQSFNDLVRSRLIPSFSTTFRGYSLVQADDRYDHRFDIQQTNSGTNIGTLSISFRDSKWTARISNGVHRWYSELRTTIPHSQEASGKASYEIRNGTVFMTVDEYIRIIMQINRRILNADNMFNAQYIHSLCCQLQNRADTKYAALHEYFNENGYTRVTPTANKYTWTSLLGLVITCDFYPSNQRWSRDATAPVAIPGSNMVIYCTVWILESREGISWTLTDYGNRLSTSVLDISESVFFDEDDDASIMFDKTVAVSRGISRAIYPPTPTDTTASDDTTGTIDSGDITVHPA